MDPLAAMLGKNGYLLTNKDAIEQRAIKVYTDRVKPIDIEEYLKSYENLEKKSYVKLDLTYPRLIHEVLKTLSNLIRTWINHE